MRRKDIPFSFLRPIEEKGTVSNRKFHHGDILISGYYSVYDRELEVWVSSIKDGDKELIHHYMDSNYGELPDVYQTAAEVHCEKMEGIDRFEDASDDSIMGLATEIKELAANQDDKAA